jgi:hypothetical protein
MKHGKLIRPNSALPGPAVGYAQSLRQCRQAWGVEIERRRRVDTTAVVSLETLSLRDLYHVTSGYSEAGERPSWRHYLTEKAGGLRWQGPLMAPTDDLTRLEPGRLEQSRSDLAWSLVGAAEEAEHLEQFGRVSFRLQLMHFGFDDELIEQAFEASNRGSTVQVSRSIERMGSALLIDGVEVGTDRWSAAVMGHHLAHGPGASGA